ncbi:MAG: S-layer homology domain-containing protein [Defluviitaleaceae bacterium]|nr:S-layer homology domain-containing protein [Defluviitaleaceae bacterium]MCL2837376.1 S-layer homology domain-containing protein [Defluviitaleaceae bacterium]
MVKLRLLQKIAAYALCFIMAMGLALGFSAERVWANPNLRDGDVSFSVRPNGDLRVTVTARGNLLIERLDVGIQRRNGGRWIQEVFEVSRTRDAERTATVTFDSKDLSNGEYNVEIDIWYTDEAGRFSHDMRYTYGGSGGSGSSTADGISFSTPTLVGESGSNLELRANYSGGTLTRNDEFGFAFSSSRTPTDRNIIDRRDASEFTNSRITGTLRTNNMSSGSTYYIFAYIWDRDEREYVYSPPLEHSHGGGRSAVRTDSTTYSSSQGVIAASGRLTSIGNSNVTELGFVYSNTESTPSLNNNGNPTSGSFKAVALTGSYNNARDFSIDFTPEAASNSTSRTFHVRAYAINTQGVSYGEVRTVNNVDLNFMGVTMSAFTVNSGTSAQADVKVTGVSANNVFEWGIAYSETVQSPARSGTGSGSAVLVQDGPRNSADDTIVLEGLKPNTRYYARAFARTRNGNYVYSAVREFTTPVAMDVELFSVQEVTHNSAMVSARVDVQGAGTIVEKGFVSSRINENPTLADTVHRHTSNADGSFNMEVRSLSANTGYYVRAYAKYGSGPNDVVYSSARNFRTLQNIAVLTISFQDANGVEVGTQTIETSIEDRLTERVLVLPGGTRLAQDRWQYTVMGNDFIRITVIRENAQGNNQGGNQGGNQGDNQPPRLPGQIPGYDPSNERAYMHGVGGGYFDPEAHGTYFTVAAMLFDLLADPHERYHHDNWFPDVDYNNPVQVNVVNFVASRGYMIGDDRGFFQTHEPINRAVVAVVISEVLDLQHKYEHMATGFFIDGAFGMFPSAFPDTNNHWARGFAWCAAQEGIFGGIPDERGVLMFRPDDPITRAQLAQVFSNLFKRSSNPLSHSTFADVPINHWAHYVIHNAAIPQH